MAVEPTTIVHASPQKDVALPGENFIVTPATKEEPLPDEVQAGEDRSISFQDQTYTFPSTATDDQIFEFLSQIPKEEEAKEPPEPSRELATIKSDEGVEKNKDGKHIAYLDTEKILTGGIGHRLTKKEKKLYPKGTVIKDAVVKEWFRIDMEEANADLSSILEDKAFRVTDDVYDILLNMVFNLGKGTPPKLDAKGEFRLNKEGKPIDKGTGLLAFRKMWAALQVDKLGTAAAEMQDSIWFGQVGDRSVRLVKRMRALDTDASPAPVVVAEAEPKDKLTPVKGGLFEDEEGKLFMVDDQGNKTEV